MKKLKKGILLGIIGCSLGISTVALAATAYPDGGTWNYGVGWNGTFGYSDYFHPSRSHTSSVRNTNTGVTNSQRASGGNWARSSLTKIPPTGLNYYYGC